MGKSLDVIQKVRIRSRRKIRKSWDKTRRIEKLKTNHIREKDRERTED